MDTKQLLPGFNLDDIQVLVPQVHVFFSCVFISHALFNVQAVGPQARSGAQYVGNGKSAAVVTVERQEAMDAVSSAFWEKLLTLDPMKCFVSLHESLASEAMVLVCIFPE